MLEKWSTKMFSFLLKQKNLGKLSLLSNCFARIVNVKFTSNFEDSISLFGNLVTDDNISTIDNLVIISFFYQIWRSKVQLQGYETLSIHFIISTIRQNLEPSQHL